MNELSYWNIAVIVFFIIIGLFARMIWKINNKPKEQKNDQN